jgi:hypothetical protein
MIRKTFKILVGNYLGERPRGRPRNLKIGWKWLSWWNVYIDATTPDRL